jgi:hypothetical protein
MNEFSQLTFKTGDLVRVEGTHEAAMPASMVGILIGLDWRAQKHWPRPNIWNVRFTNGVILKIWQGHLINLHEELSA